MYKVKRISDKKIYALKKVKLLNLSEKEKQNIKLADAHIDIHTAQGVVTATHVTDVYAHELGVTVEAMLLEDSPPVT